MKMPALLIFAMALLLSCSHNKKDNTAIAPIFKQAPLDSAYAAIRPVIQLFTIDNTKVSQIKAAGGTEVLIPAGSLETADGDKVSNAQLEIVEARSLPTFVTSGLVTLSGDKLLISNGMIYIGARAENEHLRLAKDAKLTVSMPTMTNRTGFGMFTGNGSNWTPDSSMTSIDYEIPMPLDLLYPEGNMYWWYCSRGRGRDSTSVFDTTIINVSDRKYENTIIATEEFQRRYWVLNNMTYWTSYMSDSAIYFDKDDCMKRRFNYDILKLYFDHPDKSFRELDSMAKKMYIDYYNTNKEKMAAFFDWVNERARHHFGNYTDTNYYFDFRKNSMKDQYMDVLQYWPSNTKEIKRIDTHGVDLAASDVFEQLQKKGIDQREINAIMEYRFRRQAMIKLLQRRKEAIANQNAVQELYESTVFSVSQMGWINCDRFFDDPTARMAAIYVANSGHKLDAIDISLVIPDFNARVSAYEDSLGRWRFTTGNGRYARLPMGRDAVVTGVSLQHDSLFFASKKIKITDSLWVDLSMQPINKNSLKDSLERALK